MKTYHVVYLLTVLVGATVLLMDLLVWRPG